MLQVFFKDKKSKLSPIGMIDFRFEFRKFGERQEINTGEAGLLAWFNALQERFSDWNVFVSEKILDETYTREKSFNDIISGLKINTIDKLHLAVSLRSFRSEQVSSFVNSLLDMNTEEAKNYYHNLKQNYPMFLQET